METKLTWTIRRILILIIVLFAVAMIGTLVWVTSAFQKFTTSAISEMSGAVIEQIVLQKIENHHDSSIQPFVDEWSRLITLETGILENSPEKVEVSAERMFNTVEVVTGQVRLRNVAIYDSKFNLMIMAEQGSGENLAENLDQIEALNAQKVGEKRIGFKVLWQTLAGRPVHSTIAPIGGFRLLGFIEFVTDPSDALKTIGDAVNGEFHLTGRTDDIIVSSKPSEPENKVGGPQPDKEEITVTISADDGKPWAKARVSRDVSELSGAARDLRDSAVIVVSAVALGGFCLAWLLLHFSVFGRLKGFARVMDALADGDTDVHIPPTGNDEFGTMRTAMDKLRTAVSQRLELQEQSDKEISERRKVEQALGAQKDTMEKVLENIDQGILMIDREMNIITANGRYASLLHMDPDWLAKYPTYGEMVDYYYG
jgi:methyl-accepting chemotaxis protein